MKKIGLIVSVVLLGFYFLRSAPQSFAITASEFCMESAEQAEINEINKYRTSNGFVALKVVKTLGASAEHHAQYMASTDDVDHTLAGGLSWSTNILNHGYPSGYGMGENVYAGRQSPSEALAAWKASSSHNAVMLEPSWRAIGVGRAYNANGKYKWYWAANFASYVDTSAPPLCSNFATPTPAPPTPTPAPTNYVRIPYSSIELSSGTTVNQWKNTLIYIKKNMNLNQVGFYNTGSGASYEIRTSNSGGSFGSVVNSGSLNSSPNSSGYYYRDISTNLNAGTYYVVRVYPTTGRYYYGSVSVSYSELSFLRRGNGSSQPTTTGSFQLRLRFTLR